MITALMGTVYACILVVYECKLYADISPALSQQLQRKKTGPFTYSKGYRFSNLRIVYGRLPLSKHVLRNVTVVGLLLHGMSGYYSVHTTVFCR